MSAEPMPNLDGTPLALAYTTSPEVVRILANELPCKAETSAVALASTESVLDKEVVKAEISAVAEANAAFAPEDLFNSTKDILSFVPGLS